jgi:hypothetical protein
MSESWRAPRLLPSARNEKATLLNSGSKSEFYTATVSLYPAPASNAPRMRIDLIPIQMIIM